jgi:hypothetical protein
MPHRTSLSIHHSVIIGTFDVVNNNNNNNNNNNSVTLVCERTIPTERPPLLGELNANFVRIEGVTWTAHGRILAFLDRSRYCFFQVAPQLYSRG